MTTKSIKYHNTMNTVSGPGQVTSYCNMITFTNAGTNTAFLNQTVKILPGGSIRFVGYPDEIDETVYNVSFASPGTGELYVFRKIYNSVYL